MGWRVREKKRLEKKKQKERERLVSELPTSLQQTGLGKATGRTQEFKAGLPHGWQPLLLPLRVCVSKKLDSGVSAMN